MGTEMAVARIEGGPEGKMRFIGIAVLLIVSYGQFSYAEEGSATLRDLAGCKMGAIALGRLQRDSWFEDTPTGQYLTACMISKGYRSSIIRDAKDLYSEQVLRGKTLPTDPIYRSTKAEFLLLSGCYSPSPEVSVSIVIPECWEK
jgi:hypothetical protein